jgi:MFS family permease
MKAALLVFCMVVVCALLVFLAPHHRRVADPFKACTLGEIYMQFLRDAPILESPKPLFLLMLFVAAMLSAFYPAIFVALAAWFSPVGASSGGALFVMGGLFAAAGAVANFIGMLVSHMSFGFGVSDSSRDQTPFLWIIPSFQLLFALFSILFGVSARCAGWLNYFLGK